MDSNKLLNLGFGSGKSSLGLLLALTCCFAFTSIRSNAQTHPYTGMVVFGDSLSDGGNLIPVVQVLGQNQAQYLTGWDPNYYYNYRFSNGPIWVDYLYTGLGFAGTMAANDGVNNMNGTNFAWAGSRSGTGTYGGIFPNLQLQIDFYSTQLENRNPFLPAPATTLFAIWSGANDVFAHVDSGDPITPAQVADNIHSAISSVYDEGGRYFVVPNLPPIGQIPSYLDDPDKATLATAFVNNYNNLLDATLDTLSGSLSGITIFKVDIHGLFLEIMADPAAYDFTNITDTAYIRYGEKPYTLREPPYGEIAPNSDGYFYWDAAHGTTLTNFFIAEAAYQSIVPEPNAMTLFLATGLALFSFRKMRHQANR